MDSIAAIVLAAGASVRLGTPKQLVRLGTETLLERTVRVALEAGLNPVYGVVSPGLLIEPAPTRMICVINHEAAEGMASSIRAGVRAVTTDCLNSSGIIVLACDQPAVTAGHLRELAKGARGLVASAYAKRKGIPAYFPSTAFEELLALRGATGARDLLRNSRAIPMPGGELDIDTIADLDRAREIYSGSFRRI